jgi:hypothetical protein
MSGEFAESIFILTLIGSLPLVGGEFTGSLPELLGRSLH